MAPRLLYVLTGLAVQDKDWPGALTTAKRLVAQFKDADVADDALERIVEGAAQAKAWPVVSEAYETPPPAVSPQPLRRRLARALRRGRAGKWPPRGGATRAGGGGDPALARRGRARAPGAGASARGNGRPRGSPGRLLARGASRRGRHGAAALQQARLLLDEKKWGEARGVLQPLLKASDPGEVAQAAHGARPQLPGRGQSSGGGGVLHDRGVSRSRIAGRAPGDARAPPRALWPSSNPSPRRSCTASCWPRRPCPPMSPTLPVRVFPVSVGRGIHEGVVKRALDEANARAPQDGDQGPLDLRDAISREAHQRARHVRIGITELRVRHV